MHARRLAMRRVERQARELEAAGIVGMSSRAARSTSASIEQQGYKRLDLIVTMHVLGTAIVEIDEPDEAPPIYIALATERGEQMSDQQRSEQYDPTSTAGVPEHGRERLERMKGSGLLHERPVGERVPAREGGRASSRSGS